MRLFFNQWHTDNWVRLFTVVDYPTNRVCHQYINSANIDGAARQTIRRFAVVQPVSGLCCAALCVFAHHALIYHDRTIQHWRNARVKTLILTLTLWMLLYWIGFNRTVLFGLFITFSGVRETCTQPESLKLKGKLNFTGPNVSGRIDFRTALSAHCSMHVYMIINKVFKYELFMKEYKHSKVHTHAGWLAGCLALVSRSSRHFVAQKVLHITPMVVVESHCTARARKTRWIDCLGSPTNLLVVVQCANNE